MKHNLRSTLPEIQSGSLTARILSYFPHPELNPQTRAGKCVQDNDKVVRISPGFPDFSFFLLFFTPHFFFVDISEHRTLASLFNVSHPQASGYHVHGHIPTLFACIDVQRLKTYLPSYPRWK